MLPRMRATVSRDVMKFKFFFIPSSVMDELYEKLHVRITKVKEGQLEPIREKVSKDEVW